MKLKNTITITKGKKVIFRQVVDTLYIEQNRDTFQEPDPKCPQMFRIVPSSITSFAIKGTYKTKRDKK